MATGCFIAQSWRRAGGAALRDKAAWPLLLLLVSCGAGPDDLFVISGRTTTYDGVGLSGVPIKAQRQRACASSLTTDLRQAVSGDAGTFSFDFVRVEVQSLSDDIATCTRLEATFPSGTSVWTSLAFFPYRLQLPDWNDWRAGLTFDDGGVPRFTRVHGQGALTECRGTFPEREVVEHALFARSGSSLAWEATDQVLRSALDDGGSVTTSYAEVPLVLPPEALEDFTVDVGVEARRLGCVEVPGSDSLGRPGPFQLVTRWSSAGSVRLQGRLTPPSRGADCDDLPRPCALTDGALVPLMFALPTNHFTLRLARPLSVRAVAFRGAYVDITLRPEELSVRAGSSATTLQLDGGVPDGLDDFVYLTHGELARRAHRLYVLDRPLPPASVIELESSRLFYGLAELSLFE